MSTKRIILIGVSVITLLAFIGVGINNAIKTRDRLQFQEVELKSKSLEIKQLDSDYEELNNKADEIREDKEASQEEVDALQEEKQRLEEEKARLEQEISAIKQDNERLARVANQTVNAITGTQTAVAGAVDNTASSSDIKTIIHEAAIKHGLDPNWFYNLAKCESTWNPNNVNYNYWEDSNGTALGSVGTKYHPSGLYQHLTNYWPARAAAHGYAGASVFDPVANANVTAAMWKTGSHLWECQ